MKEQVISLGGGCDVATEFIQRLQLTEETHFFDYLWNLDGGLRNVTQILRDDFAGFDSLDDFMFEFHGNWNTDPSMVSPKVCERPAMLEVARGGLPILR